jgi:hypothetical protein
MSSRFSGPLPKETTCERRLRPVSRGLICRARGEPADRAHRNPPGYAARWRKWPGVSLCRDLRNRPGAAALLARLEFDFRRRKRGQNIPRDFGPAMSVAHIAGRHSGSWIAAQLYLLADGGDEADAVFRFEGPAARRGEVAGGNRQSRQVRHAGPQA